MAHRAAPYKNPAGRNVLADPNMTIDQNMTTDQNTTTAGHVPPMTTTPPTASPPLATDPNMTTTTAPMMTTPPTASPPLAASLTSASSTTVMATYVSSIGQIGSYKDSWRSMVQFACNYCGANFQVVQVPRPFPVQAYHVRGEVRQWPSGQSGSCPECRTYWQEQF